MKENSILYLLPTAYEVWGKVMFSKASLILSTIRGVCLFPVCIIGHMTRRRSGLPTEGGGGLPTGCVCPPTEGERGVSA